MTSSELRIRSDIGTARRTRIRQNTRAIRAQTYDPYVSQFRHWNEPMRVDQAMSERSQTLIEDAANLSASEQRHAVHVLYDFVRLAENLHYQYREGMLAESVWIESLHTSTEVTEPRAAAITDDGGRPGAPRREAPPGP